MPLFDNHNASMFASRRTVLLESIKKDFPEKAASGIVVLFGAFERECSLFRQERSFYYFTGVQEPASVLMLDINSGKSTLYIPNFGAERAKWMQTPIESNDHHAEQWGFDSIVYAGKPCKGYQCHPFFTSHEYEAVLKILEECVKAKKTIFTLNPTTSSDYSEQRFIVQRINTFIPGISEQLVDISALVARQRRKKSTRELELLYKAIDITIDAHDVVARAIAPEKMEYELQALIEYMFISRGALVAFPSIVGSGRNSTVLHYAHNNKKLEKKDLVVIDIGAEYSYYCADLTRTYPVSGTFTKRQREIYNIVLEAQEYIAQCARPGFWLSNSEQPEKSLNHLAKQFMTEKGYGEYFTHGIGHFLGLDVHDVGDYKEPLAAGDVITIEPGIYLPDEQLGVRIEDDYWVIEDGIICLSENLPKQADEIEVMMQEKKEDEDQDDSDLHPDEH